MEINWLYSQKLKENQEDDGNKLIVFSKNQRKSRRLQYNGPYSVDMKLR